MPLRQHDIILAEGSFQVVLTNRRRLFAVINAPQTALGPMRIALEVDRRAFQDATRPFVVLEYMPHGSLADELAKRSVPFSLSEALSLGRALAQALADVHAKSLAHLDLKPGNVLKNADDTWRLSDFGAAVTISPQELLRAPRWVCTPAYAAPEQLLGVKSQASDVYALGVVLTELLTGSCKLLLPEFVRRHGNAAWDVLPLLGRLIASDLRMRPTAREVVTLLEDAARRAVPVVWPAAPILAQEAPKGPPPAPRELTPSSDVPPWLKFLGAAGATFLTAAALNRSTKTWDENVGRYRGAKGEFRGRGLFE